MKNVTFAILFSLVATLAPALSSMSFERAARHAHYVLIGRYITDESGHPQFEVSELLKGNVRSRVRTIRKPEWFYFAPEYGSIYFVALDRRRRPLPADSACGTVNILGIEAQYVFKIQSVLTAPEFEEWARQRVYDFGDGGSRVTVSEMKTLISEAIANRP